MSEIHFALLTVLLRHVVTALRWVAYVQAPLVSAGVDSVVVSSSS
jgi:hypothetical protein